MLLYSKILVTGCGGDIGFGIGKVLKKEKVAGELLGCDIHNEHPGSAVFDKCFIVERADSEKYMQSLLNLVKKENVELVIPVSEAEIRNLFKNNFYGKRELFLVANNEALAVGLDKLRTIEMLEREKLPAAWTQIVGSGRPKEFPCILKSRTGCGSKDVKIIFNEADIDKIERKKSDYIWQEYLLPENEEYTCGVYRTRNDEVRTIIMKRKLQGGFTGSGCVVNNIEIQQVIEKVANALNLKGSINIQLRLTKKGAFVFEINPRFSSTVVFRHKMGFEDLIWSLKEKKQYLLDTFVPVSEGMRFYRTSDEIIFLDRI